MVRDSLAITRTDGEPAGTVGTAVVLNTPGSSTGAVETLDAVLDVLPHALRLLAGAPTRH